MKSAIFLLCFSALFLFSFCGSAQDFATVIEDPMGKPEIWKILEQNPNDDAQWEVYFEKDLFSMTKEEYKNFEDLKLHLIKKYQERKDQEELELMKKKEAYLSKRYRSISDETYRDLTQNIHKNFPIIEEYFTERFEELGDQYVPFAEVYPNGDYNKSKWVDEQEEKLKELKELLKQYGDQNDKP